MRRVLANARLRPWGLALLGAAAACGGEGDDIVREWVAETSTVADTMVVRTVRGSVWRDSAWLEPVFRVGAVEGRDAELIGEADALAVAAHGTVFLLDGQVPVVRAYGPDGAHRFDVGRKGGGPGEYARPDGLAVLPDGRLLVRDPGNARISVYDATSGTFLESWPHPTGGGFNTERRFYVDTTGVAWATTLLDFSKPPWEWTYILIGVDGAGAVTDTIISPQFDFERAQVTASRENSRSTRRVPFTPQPVWSFSPFGYTVGAVTGRYAIYLFRRDAPVLRIERATAEPVAVFPEEAAERKARMIVSLQRQYPSWHWNGPDIPATKPPLRELFVDDDGRIWVVVSRPGVEVLSRAAAREEAARTGLPALRYDEPVALEAFDHDGRFLGPVALPSGFAVQPEPVIRGNDVWAILHDDLGVAYVARFRLRTP